jgi:His/Glu/Gln/Arg/opine family amino acid ABC transporter permease subunit
MQYSFDWQPIWDNRALVAEGLLTTIELSVAALVLALLLGTLVGTMGASPSRRLRLVAACYVEPLRNVPLLIHMYFWYMALAFLRLPAFACAALGLAIYSSAYMAETIRAGIIGVAQGQMRAALATGLTRFQALRLVVYPQALRNIAPSIASLASQLIKDSSLASVIAVAELTYEAGAIEGQTFRTFEIYITISLIYLALVTFVGWLLALAAGSRDTRSDTALSHA